MHRLLFLLIILSFSAWIDATTECFGLAYTDLNVCGEKGRCVATDTCVCDHSHIGEECKEFIGAIEASNMQSYVVQKNYKKFSFGGGDHGRLGHGDTSTHLLPKEIEHNEPISAVQFSSYTSHVIAWDSADNRAYSFGLGGDGRHGQGDSDNRHEPTVIPASGDISFVSAGSSHSLYISSGLIYSFGSGSGGKLGLGDNDGRNTPTLIDHDGFDDLTHISVAAGEMHSLSLTSEFKVYSWGNGWYGNLGHGDQTHHDTPQLIQDLENLVVIQIGAGTHFSIVLTNEFKIFTFGYGADGRLGHGDDDDQWSPTELVTANALNIRKFAAGPSHTLLLADDGKIYAFGLGSSGQLGLGDTDSRDTPTLIPNLEPMAQVSAGNQHSLIAKEDGTVYSFGNNNVGRTGLGYSNGFTETPTICMCPENRFGSECVVTCDGVLANEDFVCGGHGSCDDTDDCTCSADYESDKCDEFTCFEKDSNQQDVCSGNGDCADFDQCLCDEYYEGEQCDVFEGSVAGGTEFSFIVRKSKKLLGFGDNEYGYLGLGDDRLDDHEVLPVSVPLSNVTQISAYYFNVLGLNAEGKVFTWGYADPQHAFGLEGDVPFETIYEPVQITRLDDETIVQIAAGDYFSLVVSAEGKLFSFGKSNAVGRQNQDLDVPTEVEGLDGVFVTRVAAGASHSLAVSTKGRVYSFGNGNEGRLGHGDFHNQAAAKRIDSIAGIRAVSAGWAHSLLLGRNGRVYSCGNHGSGRLGLGELSVNVLEPTLISALENVTIVQIAAGDRFSLVLSDAGRVYGFGDGNRGVLGLGNEDEIYLPTLVPTLQNIRALAAGEEASLFADHHGNVYSCGRNRKGDTGLGVTGGNTLTPELVICGEDRFGDNCVVKCFDLLSSNQTVCSGQGNCTATDHCECDLGFAGNQCEDWTCSGINYNDANLRRSHHGLNCGQSTEDEFDESSYRDNLETLDDATDIADATKFFFNHHRVCRSNGCQSENEYVEFALKRLQEKVTGGDEGLVITETIDFVNDLSNSSFGLTDAARSSVIAILEKETCERQQTASVKNHMSKAFNAVHDLNFGAL